jgi:poly(A) polymerase
MDIHIKLASDEDMDRKAAILLKLENTCEEFVIKVGLKEKQVNQSDFSTTKIKILLAGSYKLGLRDPHGDIDVILSVPNFCRREHFFTLLKADLENLSDVSNFIAIEGARVPIMQFNFDGVRIDLLFARLAGDAIPHDFDIFDDNVLSGLDEESEKSLTGARVTQMIPELMAEKMYPNFLIVLRCVRKWAKNRGLYGNKFGYLGGINCTCLVVLVCQLYPNATSSTLLVNFFKLYSTWEWPKPVQIAIQPNYSFEYGRQRDVWRPEFNFHHVMPIITPAYPAVNSAANVSTHTLEIMRQEFIRANVIIENIIADKGDIKWGSLFERSDFFSRYPHYLCCHIVGIDLPFNF